MKKQVSIEQVRASIQVSTELVNMMKPRLRVMGVVEKRDYLKAMRYLRELRKELAAHPDAPVTAPMFGSGNVATHTNPRPAVKNDFYDLRAKKAIVLTPASETVSGILVINPFLDDVLAVEVLLPVFDKMFDYQQREFRDPMDGQVVFLVYTGWMLEGNSNRYVYCDVWRTSPNSLAMYVIIDPENLINSHFPANA